MFFTPFYGQRFSSAVVAKACGDVFRVRCRVVSAPAAAAVSDFATAERLRGLPKSIRRTAPVAQTRGRVYSYRLLRTPLYRRRRIISTRRRRRTSAAMAGWYVLSRSGGRLNLPLPTSRTVNGVESASLRPSPEMSKRAPYI